MWAKNHNQLVWASFRASGIVGDLVLVPKGLKAGQKGEYEQPVFKVQWDTDKGAFVWE